MIKSRLISAVLLVSLALALLVATGCDITSSGQWIKVDSPTTESLRSVVMVSANDGWAVGANGIILHYQVGG
jgi:photosystem II stability/assembly factor-like uncharacterized protein